MSKNKPRFTLYTDGGCLVNPGGHGGYGVVLIDHVANTYAESSGAYRSTTNNRMEMMAVISGLSMLPHGSSVEIVSDSQYVVRTMNGEYRRGKNMDLWAEIDRQAAGKELSFKWVKGHAKNKYNERCDALATAAMHGHEFACDNGYESADGYNAADSLFRDGAVHDGIRKDIEISPSVNGPEPSGGWRAIMLSRGITEGCAKDIAGFYESGSRNFSGYTSIRTHGLDRFSAMGLADLGEAVGKEKTDIVSGYLPDLKDRASCLRWHLRGMTLEDSIRKVMADAEIRQNFSVPSNNQKA